MIEFNDAWSVLKLVSVTVSRLIDGKSFTVLAMKAYLNEKIPSKTISHASVNNALNMLYYEGFLQKQKINGKAVFSLKSRPYDLSKITKYEDLKNRQWNNNACLTKKLGDKVEMKVIMDKPNMV